MSDQQRLRLRKKNAALLVKLWNTLHGPRTRVRMDHVIPCRNVYGNSCCMNGPRYWTTGLAVVVEGSAQLANAMVPIEGTLGLQPIERVIVVSMEMPK